MKKILKEVSRFRIKCPYCDCEFEYDSSDIFFSNIMIGALVSCPRCHNALYHAASSKSNITTEQL
jgi:hypothetical protein|nr:MAG TPA: DNA-directed RNA polymerase [Caudoviricetes sp.]